MISEALFLYVKKVSFGVFPKILLKYDALMKPIMSWMFSLDDLSNISLVFVMTCYWKAYTSNSTKRCGSMTKKTCQINLCAFLPALSKLWHVVIFLQGGLWSGAAFLLPAKRTDTGRGEVWGSDREEGEKARTREEVSVHYKMCLLVLGMPSRARLAASDPASKFELGRDEMTEQTFTAAPLWHSFTSHTWLGERA